MRRRGVSLPPSQFEAAFLSTAHQEAEVEAILEAAPAHSAAVADEAMDEARTPRLATTGLQRVDRACTSGGPIEDTRLLLIPFGWTGANVVRSRRKAGSC